jgi:methionine-R-sulfoxide reductase
MKKNNLPIKIQFLVVALLTLISLSQSACTGTNFTSNNQGMNDTLQHPNNPYYSRTDTAHLNVPNSEWKKFLSDDVYAVGREAETERAYTGKFWNFEGIGTYYCAVCGNALFKSDSKFASGCGWPSFFETLRQNSVTYKRDTSYGMIRTEVNCGRCDSHLGHVFDDGPPPTGLRFCMNSIVLDFEPDK